MKPQNLPAYRSVIMPGAEEIPPLQAICFFCDTGDVCTSCDWNDWACNEGDGFWCVTKDGSP